MRMVKIISKYLMAACFIVAGVNHFLNPAFYLKIMPPYLPWHSFLVYLSGLCEVALGLLLCVSKYSRFAAWGIIALLIAVFPANIHMATHPELYPEVNLAALWIRLPMQGLLIAWAYWYTRPDTGREVTRRTAAA
ncbi:MAG: DoxX family membrane protein [Acidobacteria bacterium]|nr:DoxX family membrane protein [Acidobacteriota bacterium]